TILLVAFALWGGVRRRAPGWSLWLATGALVAALLFHMGDGLVRDGWRRPINLSLDLPLLPDLARLLRSTVAPAALAVGAVAGLVLAVLLSVLIRGALGRATKHVAASPRNLVEVAIVSLVTVALSAASPKSTTGESIAGFSPSVVPRWIEQIRFVADARRLRESKAVEIAAVQAHLGGLPSGLEKLAGTDVLVFFIESYGHTVYTNPHHERVMSGVHRRFADELARLGMSVATGQLAAPVQGGGSWMAHATFAAGVRIADGLEFAVLRQTQPPLRTMATFFRQAGYRTLLVQPGTTRPWPEGEVTGYDRRYYAPDLAYQGPTFDWAPMPDQYVVDFIARKEITAAARPPVFATFALVSSHAPWGVLPPLVDWAKLEAGRIYNEVPPTRFPVNWQTLSRASDAYLASLAYDFTVIGEYLPRLARPDTLILVLGDHQPHAAVTGAPPAPEVPVHVISRNRALVQAFTHAAGQSDAKFIDGMRPDLGQPAPGMETFLADFLRRLSHARGHALDRQQASGSAARTVN
ncbi:MAG TPA: sulfatase-like hydrolase/transferase, partial [Polyangia bacterium]